jgi:hypothetical protein
VSSAQETLSKSAAFWLVESDHETEAHETSAQETSDHDALSQEALSREASLEEAPEAVRPRFEARGDGEFSVS